MKLFIIASALALAVTPARADGLDSLFRGINDLVHHHHRYEDEGPPPEDDGPPPEGQVPDFDPSVPGRIIHWLDKQGEVTPLIVGRRDLDCANAQEPGFIGGWGVILKRVHPDKSTLAVSGVVCVVEHQEPTLRLDQ